jgi:glyoxylase-like metal-dependent hydrolase (beta-lactamase superfamily II)
MEPNHTEEVISYLVLGAERAALIDTGMGIGNIQAEVERLTDQPVIVINTHSHFDHVGDDYRFVEVWAFDDDSEVARIERGTGHEECARFITPDSYTELPPGFDPATYEIRPSPVTHRLKAGETVDLGGRALTVHHTPGHSPGSICLLESRDRLLFTGDTYYPGPLYAHLEGSDFEAYLDSVRYLANLQDQVSHLIPSHSEIYASKEVLSQLLDAFERIATGEAGFEIQGQTQIYRFDGFDVLLPLE